MRESIQSIMLIEDGAEDFEALMRALRKAGIHNPVYRFSHGEEALDYLIQRGRYFKPGAAARPDIILLDLNLPGADGREVLQQIKSNPQLCSIPVIVLTGSQSQEDVAACYRAGANSYMLKPRSVAELANVILRLKQYWFEAAVLPRPPTGNSVAPDPR